MCHINIENATLSDTCQQFRKINNASIADILVLRIRKLNRKYRVLYCHFCVLKCIVCYYDM